MLQKFKVQKFACNCTIIPEIFIQNTVKGWNKTWRFESANISKLVIVNKANKIELQFITLQKAGSDKGGRLGNLTRRRHSNKPIDAIKEGTPSCWLVMLRHIITLGV
jgi:hypothetical protein